jgi:biopolymer transport protein ExbD
VAVSEIQQANGQDIAPIGERLDEVRESVIGLSTQTVAESQEVTILADRSVPFSVIKKVMSTCTSRGFARISLAVLQKAPENRTASTS